METERNGAGEIILGELLLLKDEKYRDFHAKLIPTLPKERIIGVRSPDLRKVAKKYRGSEIADNFLKSPRHYYLEENNIHGLLLEKMRDFDRLIFELDRFLPWVDNWATCDMMSPVIFKKEKTKLRPIALRWMDSGDIYTVRFGIKTLMSHYLREDFDVSLASAVAAVRSDEYYINMMIAWYFATALAYQFDEIIPFISEHRLSSWVNNKAIQKARESYRISPEIKEELKKYRI